MQTEHLQVTGMTCGGCVTKLTRALKAADGVGDVNVSLSSGDVAVQYDAGRTSPDQLKLAVIGAGYELMGSMPHTKRNPRTDAVDNLVGGVSRRYDEKICLSDDGVNGIARLPK